MSLAPSGSKDVVGGQALHERVTLPTLLRLLRLPAGWAAPTRAPHQPRCGLGASATARAHPNAGVAPARARPRPRRERIPTQALLRRGLGPSHGVGAVATPASVARRGCLSSERACIPARALLWHWRDHGVGAAKRTAPTTTSGRGPWLGGSIAGQQRPYTWLLATSGRGPWQRYWLRFILLRPWLMQRLISPVT
jgi:hypothetical protein